MLFVDYLNELMAKNLGLFFQGALEAKDQTSFFNSEIERLTKVTKSAKLKDKKKEELLSNLNVVKSFLHPNVGVKTKKDEL